MNIYKNYELTGSKQFYLDMFLFSYYTFGLNIIDVLRIKHTDIYSGMINMTRQKTGRLLKIPIRKEAQEIMNKYKDTKSEFVFGKLYGNETGKQLKDRTKYYTKKINKVLKETELDVFFHATRCADECHSKPHPQMLEELMDFLGVTPTATLMIGDTEFD